MCSVIAVRTPPGKTEFTLTLGASSTASERMYQDENLIERMAADYPLGLGEVKDIYMAVKFLLSDEARWVTGQQFTVDGGRTINITG